MSWLFRICPSVGLEQDPWVSLMLQGHFIPRKLLLHILHFHWSKSVHWNVWEWNAKLKKYIFLNLLDHLQSMAIVLVPLLHSSNFVKFTATLYTLLSLTCFFFLYSLRLPYHNLPHEIHATIHIDLMGQIKSWKKMSSFSVYNSFIRKNEFSRKWLTLNPPVFLSLNFSSLIFQIQFYKI